MSAIHCAACNREFEPTPHSSKQRYCSERCRIEAWRERQAELDSDEGTLPPNVYLPLSELKDAYERKCGMCGRAGEIEWLTRYQALLRGRLGLGNCDVCGGWRTLELVFGASSSPRAAAPVRTQAQPVRPVPTRLGALP